MKAVYIGLFVLMGLASMAGAQSFYVASGSGQGLNKVTVTPGGCIKDTVFPCSSQTYFAIARTGNSLYFTSNTQLFKSTIVNDVLTNCQVVDVTPVAMTSLACDINGTIYSARLNDLYMWVPGSGLGFQLLGSMPFVSAGDIIFYQGDLYMASTTGIVKVDITNPSASTMHIPMPGQAIYGLAALPVDCNTTKVYAFETTDAGDGTDMIELDLPNQQVVNVVCQLPFGVADAASEAEGGNVAAILINEIRITPQCKEPGKGTIRVLQQGLATYNFILNGTVTNTTGLFEHLDPGDHHIRIIATGGCTNQKDTIVTVPLFNEPPPTVIENKLAPDCVEGGKVWFTIIPDNGSNQVIYNSIDTVTASYQFKDLGEGSHHFVILDEFFCEIDTKDIVLAYEGPCDTVFFPNAFTPNNDGLNDVFRGSGNRSLKNYSLSVYTRWGELVFATTNVQKGWDGRVGNIDQATGLYVWVATYSTKEGVPKKRKGTVVLLR